MPYYFRLPLVTDLTIEQQAVLNETQAVAVFGGPGTGKSVVSLWRHIRNHSTGRRNSLLLTYTVSLASYLSNSAKSENRNAGENVDRTYRWLTESATDDYEEMEELTYFGGGDLIMMTKSGACMLCFLYEYDFCHNQQNHPFPHLLGHPCHDYFSCNRK